MGAGDLQACHGSNCAVETLFLCLISACICNALYATPCLGKECCRVDGTAPPWVQHNLAAAGIDAAVAKKCAQGLDLAIHTACKRGGGYVASWNLGFGLHGVVA